MTLGLAIYRAGWSSSDDGSGNLVGSKKKIDISNNQTGIKLGMLMESSSDMSLDASLLFRLNGSSAEYTDANTGASPSAAKFDASGTELGINARMFYKWSEKMTLVPLLRFSTFGYEPEKTTTPAPATIANTKPNKYGRSEFELGIGDNIKMESGMVTVGLSVQSISLTHDVTNIVGTDLKITKQSMSWFDLPKINVGSEFWLNSWAALRAGYFKRFSTRTTTIEPPSPGVKTEYSYSTEAGYAPNFGLTSADQQISLGLGISWGSLAVDGYVAESFFADGPYIFSGKTQSMFGLLSMSYKY